MIAHGCVMTVSSECVSALSRELPAGTSDRRPHDVTDKQTWLAVREAVANRRDPGAP